MLQDQKNNLSPWIKCEVFDMITDWTLKTCSGITKPSKVKKHPFCIPNIDLGNLSIKGIG